MARGVNIFSFGIVVLRQTKSRRPHNWRRTIWRIRSGISYCNIFCPSNKYGLSALDSASCKSYYVRRAPFGCPVAEQQSMRKGLDVLRVNFCVVGVVFHSLLHHRIKDKKLIEDEDLYRSDVLYLLHSFRMELFFTLSG